MTFDEIADQLLLACTRRGRRPEAIRKQAYSQPPSLPLEMIATGILFERGFLMTSLGRDGRVRFHLTHTGALAKAAVAKQRRRSTPKRTSRTSEAPHDPRT